MIFWFLCDRFPVDDRGTVKTVVQYFMETYGFSIQHTTLPCLQVGNQQRPNYLPMEVSVFDCLHWTWICYIVLINLNGLWMLHPASVLCLWVWNMKFQVCKIVEGQRYSKRLNEKQITALLKVTCQRPQERELDILQVAVYRMFLYELFHQCIHLMNSNV